jgi:hypothetical protein
MDRSRWAKFSTIEQMANIGSEVGRSINAYRRGDGVSFEADLDRALDLFSATAELLAAQHSRRIREVLRVRDQFLQLFYGSPEDFRDASKLEEYFIQFGVAARALRSTPGGARVSSGLGSLR